MTQQKFTASEREAIWVAHEKKCAYTRELLDLSAVHIDHIIPESLIDDPAKFEKLKADLGLSKDFDLSALDNILPCKPGANLQKGSTILDPAPIHYFLGIAASKKSEVEKNLKRIEKRQNRGRALVLLQQCLERDELSPQEVLRILEEHGEQPQEIFRLIEGMKFADATEVNVVAKADIDDLRGRPVRLGENDHIEGLTLANATEQEVFVRTCKEYDAATNMGFCPQTNFDLKMSVFFRHQCGLLAALQSASTAETSFIAEPRVGVIDLHLMPFSLFPQIGDSPSDWTGVTYQSKIDDGSLVVKRLRQNALVVEEPEGMGQQLVEVARADFNGDGIEDILLFGYCYATHGTLGFGGTIILTRKGPNGLFELVNPDAV
jgi:hypothetical protein